MQVNIEPFAIYVDEAKPKAEILVITPQEIVLNQSISFVCRLSALRFMPIPAMVQDGTNEDGSPKVVPGITQVPVEGDTLSIVPVIISDNDYTGWVGADQYMVDLICAALGVTPKIVA
jgi:hypothetical protein